MNNIDYILIRLTFIVLLTQAMPTFAEAPPPVYEPIDPYLATPAAGHIYEIPVVIMRFLPTSDGVNLDVSKAPDLGEISLTELKARIDVFDKRVKFMLEEGTRFRGYKDPTALPSLGYRVAEYITVYEQTPLGPVIGHEDEIPVYAPDFHQIFNRFNMEHYVNDLGVKEIWVWMGARVGPNIPLTEKRIHWWESNMSSPLTGDVSNSNIDNADLPVYNSTYTVYGQNFGRSHAEAVHNHGHQLEAILSHVNHLQYGNADLFWKKFVGKDEAGNFITGRAGWTHMPPNTTKHYDYTQNTTLVESDIEDWTPDNSGSKKLVNVDTYGNLAYPWPEANPADIPQRVESQWYIYWMQNMPGHENQIQYENKDMTNWWAFTANWDTAVSSGVRLVFQTPDEVGFTEMSDEFDGGGHTLQSFWQIRNADKSSWELKDGQLVIDAGFNQNLWINDTTTRFYQVTDRNEFEIETAMTVNYSDACAVAGIIVYSATGEWVTLKLWGHSKDAAILSLQRRGQVLAPDIHLQPLKGVIPSQLRIKRSNDDFEAWYKPNAQGDWVPAGSAPVALQGPVEIGIYAGICAEESPGRLTVSFDYFRIESAATDEKATPDFDGDGTVGIADFLLFARRFGLSQGDEGYELRYDLDGDGAIGISDFLIFVEDFGKSVV